MADILIRGISKPTDCGKCFVGDRTMCVDGCPLDELPEHGEWIEDRMDCRCSVCGKTVKDEIIYMLEPYQFPAFCPYCGAKLEPPKEETE